MAEQDGVYLKEFIIESHDGLTSIKSLLVELEKNPGDLENINNIFRSVHTLKGSASFFGFLNLKTLSHAVEGVLDALRRSRLIFNAEVYDILIESFDIFTLILVKIEESKSDKEVDVDSIVTKLDLFLEIAAMNKSVEVAAPAPAPVTTPKPAAAPAVTAAKEEKVAPPVLVEDVHAPILNDKHPDQVESQIIGGESKKSASVTDSIVKVNVQLLDQIMNMIGELVVNRNQILQYTGKYDDFDLQKLTHQLDVITGELQNEIMSTRMQPVGQVLNKFERIVRDMSKTQGKKIQLLISGQETELDKTLIEAIKDPLTHLVRNAIDHGIELPEKRVKAKKLEIATLKLRASHENGKVSIRIQDDGNGIDHEKVKAVAIKKGVITKEAGDKMGVKELVNLIFAPGFSTAETITDISGRGVGMDVVKTNIEKIGGEIDIQTVRGLGTTITLRIPLTLAIIPSLTVRSNNKAYCIPQVNIVEFVLIDLVQKNNLLYQMHGVNFFRLREKLIPIYLLSSILEEDDHASLENLDEKQFMNLVIVNGDGQEYGVVVDEIFEIEEIVVKPLSKNLKNLEYYSGATVMGNGGIALILETSAIIKAINPNRIKNDTKIDQETYQLNAKTDAGRDFLTFSLRDNKKYGLLLSFIERIDDISAKDINFAGDRIFAKYRDHVMPLIDPEMYLDKTSPFKVTGKSVQILVINIQSHLIGLIVNKVFDTLNIVDEIDEFAINHPMLAGTVFVKEDPILILNLTKILSSINIQIADKNNRKTLYHVDDSKIHRGIFKDIISTEFPEIFEIISFASPAELLTYFKKNEATLKEDALFVTDIDMPKMTGWELVDEVTKSFKRLKLSYMTLTSRDTLEDREKSKELNILHHLIKFNKATIVTAIKLCLGWETAEPVALTEIEDFNMLNQFCGFRIGKESYAIPIVNIQEVVSAQFISEVPKSPSEVKGLINLRGQIVTSISLRDVFHYDKPIDDEHMNIIVKNGDGFAALMIDEILDVMNFDESQHALVPDNVSADLRKYFNCVYKEAKGLTTIVNVEAILNDIL